MMLDPKAQLPSIEPPPRAIKGTRFALVYRAYEVVQFEDDGSLVAAIEWVVERPPKSSCPRCFGKGTVGKVVALGTHQPCSCMGKVTIVATDRALIAQLRQSPDPQQPPVEVRS